MRFNLVFLSFMIIWMTGVSHAETLSGRVVKIDRTISAVNLALETVDVVTHETQQVVVTIADLPRDIQLNSRITVKTHAGDEDDHQGARSMATFVGFDSASKNGQDKTGVRSRMKQAQGGRSTSSGSQRGKH